MLRIVGKPTKFLIKFLFLFFKKCVIKFFVFPKMCYWFWYFLYHLSFFKTKIWTKNANFKEGFYLREKLFCWEISNKEKRMFYKMNNIFWINYVIYDINYWKLCYLTFRKKIRRSMMEWGQWTDFWVCFLVLFTLKNIYVIIRRKFILESTTLV